MSRRAYQRIAHKNNTEIPLASTLNSNDYHAWADVVDRSVGANTLRSYETYLQAHKELGYSATADGFLQHLSRKEHAHNKGTAKVLKNAILHDLRRHKVEITQFEKDLMFTAIRSTPDSSQLPRGAIDAIKLEQLVSWVYTHDVRITARCSQWGADKIAAVCYYLTLCWCTGLRRCQMRTVTRSNVFYVEEQERWYLLIEKVHDPNARSKSPQWLTIPVQIPCETTCPTAHKFYQVFEKQMNGIEDEHAEETLLAPDFERFTLNRYIKQASKQLKWVDEMLLKFDGVHCLRHGVTTEVRRLQGLNAARIQAGHSAPMFTMAMTEHYSTPNELRMSKQDTEAAPSDAAAAVAAMSDHAAANKLVRAQSRALKKKNKQSKKEAAKKPKKAVVAKPKKVVGRPRGKNSKK